jgi:hypothetical protein
MKRLRRSRLLFAIAFSTGVLAFDADGYASEDGPGTSSRYIKDLRSAADYSINFSRIKQTKDGGCVMLGTTDQYSERDPNGKLVRK